MTRHMIECRKHLHKWLLDLCTKSVCIGCTGTIDQFKNALTTYTTEPPDYTSVYMEIEHLKFHQVCVKEGNTYTINVNLLRAHRYDLRKKSMRPRMTDVIITAKYSKFTNTHLLAHYTKGERDQATSRGRIRHTSSPSPSRQKDETRTRSAEPTQDSAQPAAQLE